MNILVSVMVLCTCVLLILVSNSAYNKTVIEPYVLKMENTTVDTEAMKPFLTYFMKYIGTEELDAIWEEDRFERTDLLMDWMQQQPSMIPGEPEEERTLLNDWVDFSLILVNIRSDDGRKGTRQYGTGPGKGYPGFSAAGRFSRVPGTQ